MDTAAQEAQVAAIVGIATIGIFSLFPTAFVVSKTLPPPIPITTSIFCSFPNSENLAITFSVGYPENSFIVKIILFSSKLFAILFSVILKAVFPPIISAFPLILLHNSLLH